MAKKTSYEIYRKQKTVKGIDAVDVVVELDRIHEHHGVLTAKGVVEESRPDDAVLHPAFEWDDKIAGERWREHEARELIRSVVLVKGEGETATRQPVYINTVRMVDDGAAVRSYEPAMTVINDSKMLDSALSLLRHQVSGVMDTIARIERMMHEPERRQRVGRMAEHAKNLKEAAEHATA